MSPVHVEEPKHRNNETHWDGSGEKDSQKNHVQRFGIPVPDFDFDALENVVDLLLIHAYFSFLPGDDLLGDPVRIVLGVEAVDQRRHNRIGEHDRESLIN